MNEKILLDTDILVYAHHQGSPRQKKAQQVVVLTIKQANGVIAWQNLLEFYNAVTDKRKVSSPMTPQQAEKIIENYKKSGLALIYPDASSYSQAVELTAKLDLKGKQTIFDVLLVTTMKQWGVKTIYTTDLSHFKVFPEIKVVNPF